ncbi:uncharacterized protein DNG_10222 [Cephalotrichum gorgonifer]|uniref:MFS_1 domain-containing protein n=1 Tax=Cephalotrichum gorgonifer TaxID=2041049 RepID=A0AAE8T049_9PEZI|nr:uncharacterized protein DNG_10222 [Cephalotrichum gorgonifer]
MSSTQTITAVRPPAASLRSGNAIQLDRLGRRNSSDHSQHTLPHLERGPAPNRQNSAGDHWSKMEGWLVVSAGSALFFVYLGLVYSYGIVQLHLVEARLASVSTLSFVGSLAAAIAPLTGMIVTHVIGRVGHRTTAVTGSFLLGLGEFTAGWSTKSVPALFITWGAVFGVGAAFLFITAATVPSLWFKRKRGLARGPVYAGAGIGSALIAVVLEKLIDSLGLETAMKVMVVSAWAICLPVAWFLKVPPGQGRAVSRVQGRLFQSLKFLLMLVMGAIATFPLFVPPFLLPLYVSSVGLSKQTGAALVACWSIASAMGRIGMGFGADALFGR